MQTKKEIPRERSELSPGTSNQSGSMTRKASGIPSPRAPHALTVTDSTVTVGFIVERGGKRVFTSRLAAMRAIPAVHRSKR
jgi:hypothetical protein